MRSAVPWQPVHSSITGRGRACSASPRGPAAARLRRAPAWRVSPAAARRSVFQRGAFPIVGTALGLRSRSETRRTAQPLSCEAARASLGASSRQVVMAPAGLLRSISAVSTASSGRHRSSRPGAPRPPGIFARRRASPLRPAGASECLIIESAPIVVKPITLGLALGAPGDVLQGRGRAGEDGREREEGTERQRRHAREAPGPRCSPSR